MPAIRIENLSKRYRINHEKQRGEYGTLREAIIEKVAAPFRSLRNGAAIGKTEDFWALKDINFEVEPGEVVGIIGRNGAGKSTLLKILSQITSPTTGRVELYGRVGSLLEVGTGFHPELSGRDNIFLNGSILGMGRREIQKEFDAIVDFSGVEKFLDTPVKRYSSGMKVRLAFAVAAHLQPEILIIDEVLAVGDAEFQKKCLGKMQDVAAGGRTVLFVSHNMAAVQNLCSRTIVLSEGRIVYRGTTIKGISAYLDACADSVGTGTIDLTQHPARRKHCSPLITKLRLSNAEGENTSVFVPGKIMQFEFTLEPSTPLRNPQVGIGVDDCLGTRLFSVATYLSDCELDEIRGQTRVRCVIDSLPLAPGRYTLSLSAGVPGDALMDALENAVAFDVEASNFYGNGTVPNVKLGRVLVKSNWQIIEECSQLV